MNPRVAHVFVLSIVFVLSTGCGDSNSGTLEPENTRFENVSDIAYDGFAPGRKGGRFVSVLPGSGPETFNPALSSDPIAVHLARLMNGALVRRNQMTMEWEPWLAEKWEITGGEKEITFHLREGLRWSDGKPITAGDWVFAAKVALTPGISGDGWENLLIDNGIARFIAVDEITVKIFLPAPYSGAFQIAALYPLPEHILGPVLDSGVEQFNRFWGKDTDAAAVVGSGPFIISRHRAGQMVEMVANPHYHERDSFGLKLPYIDTYVVEFVEDEEAAVDKMLAGGIDHCIVRIEDGARAVEAMKEIDFELYDSGPDSETLVVAFNQNPVGVASVALEWMKNKQFRLALSHLVDRKRIVQELSFGLGYPSFTFLPRSSPYYWSEVDGAAPGYDPEKARELLDRIGYRDRDGDGIREDRNGNMIELTIRTNEDNGVRVAICEQFSREAEGVGIRIGCEPESFNTIVTRLISGYDWELLLIGFAGEIDPLDQGAIFLSNGTQHVIEPGQDYPRREWEAYVDTAWRDAAATLDEGAKKMALEKVQRTWIEEAPWVYTYSPAVIHAYKRTWGNIFPRSADGYGLSAILPKIYERSR